MILGVIFLFSFSLIPVFLLAGYNYRVVGTAVHGIINGRDPLPEFDDIIGMFIDGIKVVIVQIVYLIVPAVTAIVFTLIANQLSGALASEVEQIGCFITLILGIMACLMIRMGICHVAYNEGAFTKAFAVEEIKDIINDIGLFKCLLAYVGIIIIGVVLGIVVTGSLLGFSLITTFLVTAFVVVPYVSIFTGRSIGLLYAMQI